MKVMHNPVKVGQGDTLPLYIMGGVSAPEGGLDGSFIYKNQFR